MRLLPTGYSMLSYRTKPVWPRAAFAKLEHAKQSCNDLTESVDSVQKVWSGARGSTFLTGSQIRSLLLALRPHSEEVGSKQCSAHAGRKSQHKRNNEYGEPEDTRTLTMVNTTN